jgi:CheY-like chemotaxis protein
MPYYGDELHAEFLKWHPKTLSLMTAAPLQQYIFLIEDDDELRASLDNLLRFSGYTVFGFADPSDFLKFNLQVAPAIVITDMRLPGMDGIELQRKVLESGRQLPFVFISGESSLQQSITAMKQGAFDFLLKHRPLLDAFDQHLAADVFDRLFGFELRGDPILHMRQDRALLACRHQQRQTIDLTCRGHLQFCGRHGQLTGGVPPFNRPWPPRP